VHVNEQFFVQHPTEVQAVLGSTLAELLAGEKEASVRAGLGHWIFGHIHPFPDGNGHSR